VQLSSARINRADALDFSLKQAVGKSTRRRAHVDAFFILDVDFEMIKRRLKLKTASADVFFPLGYLNGMLAVVNILGSAQNTFSVNVNLPFGNEA
jgi:hypothetical protein